MKTYKKLTLGLLALTTLSLSSCGIAGAPSDSSESMSSSSGASSSVSSSSSPSSEQAKTYTVTFNSNGGAPVEPQTVAEGEKIAKPADPTKEGNTFLKWTISGDEWFFGKDRVFEDITLDANWQINQYTITFDTDGGSPIDPITADYGAPITKPADPAKEGHTFLGWDKEIPSAMPAEDLAIKASWQVNQYTITWLNGMGGTLAETTLDFGSAITPIESPSDPYYEFGGWNKEVPETMPASDVVITATWKQGPWTFSGSELTKYSGTAEHVEIPPYTPWGASVTSIGASAFYRFRSLASITIPSSVTSIGDYAFDGCTSLASIVLPSSVTSIGSAAFRGCTSLTSITIPSSVTSIGPDAFEDCTSLASVTIPSSVAFILLYAFRGCTSLSSIVIPSSVEYIGDGAFYDCSSLTDIYCEAESQPAGWGSKWLFGCDATVHWGYKGE